MSKVEIDTQDGKCPAYVFRPSSHLGGEGPWPAVLVFMDGVGIRPAMLEVGERIAAHGYFVLLPDLFYRAGPYEPMNAKTVFTDPEQRKMLMDKFFSVVSTQKTMSDTGVFLDWLAKQPDVKPGKIGTTGYCMGGRMSLTAAGAYPDGIATTAAYHPGRVVIDDIQAPRIKSRVYVAGASEDPSFTDADKAALEEALTKASVDHEIETYPAKHGWCLTDTPAYDKASAERHYETLFTLLDAKLKT